MSVVFRPAGRKTTDVAMIAVQPVKHFVLLNGVPLAHRSSMIRFCHPSLATYQLVTAPPPADTRVVHPDNRLGRPDRPGRIAGAYPGDARPAGCPKPGLSQRQRLPRRTRIVECRADLRLSMR